jgi:aminomethyltransferase
MNSDVNSSDLQRTFLYENHIVAEARIAPFGGYLMPIQYEGIIREHHSTREFATIFDTCHMGEFRIEGDDSVSDLERLVTSRVDSIEIGQCDTG